MKEQIFVLCLVGIHVNLCFWQNNWHKMFRSRVLGSDFQPVNIQPESQLFLVSMCSQSGNPKLNPSINHFERGRAYSFN